MFYPVNINFHDSHVLIFGGTSKAIQWAKQFLYYGARIRYVAPELPIELKGINQVISVTRDPDRVYSFKNENIIAIDTGDYELDLFLAQEFESKGKLVLTAESTCFSNISLPDINQEELNKYISKLRNGTYSFKIDLPKELLQKLLEKDDSVPYRESKTKLIIGIPDVLNNLKQLGKVVDYLKTKLPNVKLETLALSKIGKDRLWPSVKTENPISLNSPINLAYEALKNNIVDIVLIDGLDLPAVMPEGLKFIGGFYPRIDQGIVAVLPKEYNNFLDPIGKLSYIFYSESLLMKLSDFLPILDERKYDLWENYKILEQEELNNLAVFILNNKDKVIILPYSLLVEKVWFQMDQLKKNDQHIIFTLLPPESLNELIVGVIKDEPQSQIVYETIKPAINKDEELMTLFEHFYIQYSHLIYQPRGISVKGWGFVKTLDGEFQFISYRNSGMGINDPIITQGHKEIRDTINEVLNEI